MQSLQASDRTYLNLPTRDGAVAVEFEPALEPKHYAELRELVQDFDSESHIRAIIADAAKRWNREVMF